MSTQPAATELRPVVPFLKVPAAGDPYLEGHVCRDCNSVFLGSRAVCSRCGARDRMDAKPLQNAGTLYTYSIVFRSFPGIDVPYVSAVVDLVGGGTLKGNLIGVEPTPDAIPLGMPVRVVYREALGRKDKDGNGYLAYFFEPASATGTGAARSAS